MKINIKIFSPRKIINLSLDGENNIVKYNGQSLNKDLKEEIEKLINIFASFENPPNDYIIIDGESYEIEVIDGKTSSKISGTRFGDYPKNYKQFKNIIEGIIKCF